MDTAAGEVPTAPVTGNVTQATQTVTAAPSPAARQAFMVVTILAGLGAVFFYRRRRKGRWLQLNKSRDAKDAEGEEKHRPTFGYRATILGLDSTQNDPRFFRPESQDATRRRHRDSSAEGEAAFLIGRKSTSTTWSGRLSTLEQAAAPEGLERLPQAAEAWSLDERPRRPTLRIFPVENDLHTGKFSATTPTLAEIREHLTHSDREELKVPQPAMSRAEWRWSATTFSSSFTASSQASTTAYISPLQPPPVPKRAHDQAGTGAATLGHGPEVEASSQGETQMGSIVVEDTDGRSVLTDSPSISR